MVVGVGQQVHVEGGDADVLLVADVAALHILPSQLKVGLSVPGEVGARSKAFPTISTFVSGEIRLGADLGPAVVVEERVHCEGLDREGRRGEGRRERAGGHFGAGWRHRR